MTIIARKPRTVDSEFIIVERIWAISGRFVVGTATAQSLSFDEWFWGHYFETFAEAYDYFQAVR